MRVLTLVGKNLARPVMLDSLGSHFHAFYEIRTTYRFLLNDGGSRRRMRRNPSDPEPSCVNLRRTGEGSGDAVSGLMCGAGPLASESCLVVTPLIPSSGG